MNQTKKITVGTKLRFGIGDFGLSVLTSAIQFFMLFYYTDVVKIDPGLAGTAMLVGKLTWDMINDVLFGYLADKTKSRWGRRRPYLMFCAVPMAIGFWFVFALPEGMNNVTAFFAIIVSFFFFDTFSTMINTAYSAMTAELSEDYDERTSISTYRMVFNVVGYIFGAALTQLLAGIFQDSFGLTLREAWSLVGLSFGILAAITILIPGLTVKNPPAVESEPTQLPPLKALISTLKNKPFVHFLVIASIMSIAFTTVTTMLPYFIKYQIGMGDKEFIIMGLMLAVLGIFLVPCKNVIDKLGKGKTYALGLTIACVALIGAFFLPHKASMLIYPIAIVAGIGFSAQWVCPHSMMPDVVEYDELQTGERREGIYYGMWGMVGKITGALGVAICGWGLDFFGYVAPDSSITDPAELMMTQSDMSLFGIRFMFALLTAILLLICVPLLIKYPITRESHAKVVEELHKRRAAKHAVATSDETACEKCCCEETCGE